MIETTDEAVTYLEMVARRESGDLAEAALIVTRTLRQATQTLADHAQASGVREGDGAGVSDEALRRLAEKLYGEPALGIYAGLCRVAEEVAEEARRQERKRIEGIVRGFAHNEHEVPTNHVVLEILGHIRGGER